MAIQFFILHSTYQLSLLSFLRILIFDTPYLAHKAIGIWYDKTGMVLRWSIIESDVKQFGDNLCKVRYNMEEQWSYQVDGLVQ